MPEHGPVCGRPLLLPHAEEVHDRGRGVPRAVRALPAVRRGQLREPGVPEGLAEADLPQPPAPLVAESGRRPSEAACAKRGPTGQMQTPAELVPVRNGPQCGVKAP